MTPEAAAAAGITKKRKLGDDSWLWPTQKLMAACFSSSKHSEIIAPRAAGSSTAIARQILMDLLDTPGQDVKVAIICTTIAEAKNCIDAVHKLIYEGEDFTPGDVSTTSLELTRSDDPTLKAKIYTQCPGRDSTGMRLYMIGPTSRHRKWAERIRRTQLLPPEYLRVVHTVSAKPPECVLSDPVAIPIREEYDLGKLL